MRIVDAELEELTREEMAEVNGGIRYLGWPVFLVQRLFDILS